MAAVTLMSEIRCIRFSFSWLIKIFANVMTHKPCAQVPKARLWTQPLPPNKNLQNENKEEEKDEKENDKLPVTTPPSLPSDVLKTTTIPPLKIWQVTMTTKRPMENLSGNKTSTRSPAKATKKPTLIWNISTRPLTEKAPTSLTPPTRWVPPKTSVEMGSSTTETTTILQTKEESSRI